MKVPYLALAAELDREPVHAAIRDVIQSGMFVGGPVIEDFERRFALAHDVPHAIAVNSGTDALFLVLRALGVGPGDEVVTVSNSFVATAGAIAACGARPVFVDIGPDYQMDPSLLAEALGPRTRAVIPVHLTGLPAAMDEILGIAGQAGVPVLADAAQAVGARYRGRSVGALGLAVAFSLHPLKNLNVAGDGGLITTSDAALATRLRRLANHGLVTREDAVEFGWNSRLDAIQAAVGRVVLERLPEITRRRLANAARYDELLAPLEPRVVLPPRPSHVDQVFHTYVIQCDRRDELRTFLADQGVETKIHYPVPIHLQTAGRALGYGPGDFPETERQATRIVTLPVHQHMAPGQVEYVVDRIAAFYAGGGGG